MTFALDREIISTILNSKHNCPFFQRKILCLLSKAVYHTSIPERIIQTKAVSASACKTCWNARSPWKITFWHCEPPLFLHCLKLLVPFSISMLLYQRSWLRWQKRKSNLFIDQPYWLNWQTKGRIKFIYHVIKVTINRTPSSNMRLIYNTDFHQVL